MSDELNVWRQAYAAWCDPPPHLAFSQSAAAVIRDYGDKRDADAYQRGKLEGARLALEAAAREADEHARLAWGIGEREGQSSICSSGRNYGARAVEQSIRALDPAKIVARATHPSRTCDLNEVAQLPKNPLDPQKSAP